MGRRPDIPVDPAVLSCISAEGMDPQHLAEISEVLVLHRDLKEYVATAVESLPEPQRCVIEGWFYERLTLDEIASRYDLGHRSTVMRVRDRALEILRQRLGVTRCPILWRRYCYAASHGGSLPQR